MLGSSTFGRADLRLDLLPGKAADFLFEDRGKIDSLVKTPLGFWCVAWDLL